MLVDTNHLRVTGLALSSYAPARITIILHQLGWGGVERVASILANGFVEQGIQTELLVCARGGPCEEVLKSIIGENVKLRFFRPSSGHRAKDLLLGFVKMGRYLQSSKPDAVLSAGNNVSLFTMLLTRIFCTWKTRLFIKTTNPVLWLNDGKYKRLFRRSCYAFIFRFSDGVLTLTNSESRHLKQAFFFLEDKVVTVSNPYVVDSKIPCNAGKPPGLKKRPQLIIAAGRMHRQIRFDILLHAFSRVGKMMDCRLVILGDGEDREALEDLSVSLGISHLVDMPGFVANVNEWFSKSDLFVLSSNYEGLPAVVLESLAHNCSVISTECFHGARELLAGAAKCGVIPVRDPESLAIAIMKSMERSCSTAGLHQLAENYRIGRAVKSHISAINHLISREQSLVYR